MENSKSYTIINGDYVIFKGEISPLSNFYEKAFTDEDGNQYPTMEHFFQYKKAVFFNDTSTAYKILKTPKALLVKRMAKQIKNYNDHIWMNVRNQIMYKGLTLKFQDEELKNYLKKCYLNENKPKIFIENSGHCYWGANIKNIFSPINHYQINGANTLGNMLNMLAKEMFGHK